MKHAIFIAAGLVLLSFVPVAAADFSILNGTAVIHTDGDPGVSALGNPVLRVDAESDCSGNYPGCTVVYGNPAGAQTYVLWIYGGPCDEWDVCVVAPLVQLSADAEPAAVLVCAAGVTCALVQSDPVCVGTYVPPPGPGVVYVICET